VESVLCGYGDEHGAGCTSECSDAPNIRTGCWYTAAEERRGTRWAKCVVNEVSWRSAGSDGMSDLDRGALMTLTPFGVRCDLPLDDDGPLLCAKNIWENYPVNYPGIHFSLSEVFITSSPTLYVMFICDSEPGVCAYIVVVAIISLFFYETITMYLATPLDFNSFVSRVVLSPPVLAIIELLFFGRGVALGYFAVVYT